MATTADLVATYTARYNRLRVATATAVGRLWDREAGVDERALQRFAEAAAQLVEASQAQVAAAVDGYMALLAQASPIGVDLSYPRSAEPSEVYSRGVITARSALAAGMPFVQAMAKGRARTVNTAATDVSLAQRQATAEVVDRQPGIVGYRRTLTKDSCALCAAASTQRYRGGDLAPIHGSCDCGVAPILGTRDPGRVVNDRLLTDLRSSETRGGPDYWNDKGFGVDEHGVIRRRVDVNVLDADGNPVLTESGKPKTRMELREPLKPAVHDHGELGPVLSDPHHDFAGPSDLAA